MAVNFKELALGEEFMDLLREPETIPASMGDVEGFGLQLEANLGAQLDLYREYLATAERQKTAMANRRLAESQEINVESERLLGRLAALEAERISIVSRIAAERPGLSAVPSQVKCEALYPHLSPALAARIKDVRTLLFRAVEDLKRVMEVNRSMVENGSRIIHTTIGIMTSVVGRPKAERMSTYTKKGALNVGKVQVRNLINRSV